MKPSSHQTLYRWIIICIGSAVMLYVVGGSFYIEHQIEVKIQALHGKTSSIKADLFARSLKIKDLEWGSMSDSADSNPYYFRLKSITVKGVSLYQLLVHKFLVVKEVIIDGGQVQYHQKLTQEVKESSPSTYNVFAFGSISLNNIETVLETNHHLRLSGLFTGQLTNAILNIDSINHLSYSAKEIVAQAEKINVTGKGEFYRGSIARLQLNTKEQTISLDSFLLIPTFSKYEFAPHLGKQTDRISLAVPQLLIKGWQFDKVADSTLIASTIEIKSFDVTAFRDKRVPVKHETYVPLPMAGLLKLPYPIKVDSILISDSRITVEEISEKGTQSGTVTFEEVNATWTGLNNRIQKNDPSFSLLEARGLFMGVGQIKALFKLPLDGSSTYATTGSLTNMPLTKLNVALEPIANIRIESGHVNKLSFHFNYTDRTSKGTLDIDYQDLQLRALDKYKHSNDFKTIFLNTMVKNDRNKLSAKQIGVIDIERDQHRFIFNVWWKSIRDGLKSIVLAHNK